MNAIVYQLLGKDNYKKDVNQLFFKIEGMIQYCQDRNVSVEKVNTLTFEEFMELDKKGEI